MAKLKLSEYLVLPAVVLAAISSWIWQALYLERHATTDLGFTIGLLVGILILALSLTQWLVGSEFARLVLKVGILACLILVIGKFCQARIKAYTGDELSNLVIFAVPLLAIPFALLVAKDFWQRLCRALLVFSVIFALSPFAIASFSRTEITWPKHSTAPEKQLADNIIMLMLDELNAGFEGEIISALKAQGLQTDVRVLEPVSDQTLTAIPVFFGSKPIPNASSCGLTQLCEGLHVFDFKNIKPATKKIDVVGFYHPYCSINDLRSCIAFPFPAFMSVTRDLACRIYFVQKKWPVACLGEPHGVDEQKKLVSRIWDAADKAPFWQDGGLLYVHAFAPHPILGQAGSDLGKHYDERISETALQVAKLAARAKSRFGDNFKLVIFADHPLRVNLWCGKFGYVGEICARGDSADFTKVPLIVAANKAPTIPVDLSLSQVFDLAF